MGIFETAKEAMKLAKAIGDIPLQQTIIELQEQVFEMQGKYKTNVEDLEKEALALRSENNRLNKALNQHGNMQRDKHHLWELEGNKVIAGPFCVTCWETDYKKLSLVEVSGSVEIMCPKCEHPMYPYKPHADWEDVRRND